RACDMEAAEKMLAKIEEYKQLNNSAGGIVECRITGLPAGLGEPVFDKFDALLAQAVLSIGAVKGIEFGSGFAAADMSGLEHNDAMSAGGFLTNHAGGILGGITTGEEVLFRCPVKPVSSVAAPQKTVTLSGEETEIRTEGRHDACICPRVVPVVEAMAALTAVDLLKRQQALKL
ncbi:MAG: chorismate synthase, partial [Spirochaetia bacterium]